VALSLLSILALKSVSPTLAGPQFIFFVIGFLVFWLVSYIPFNQLERWRWLGYASLCILLIIPLVLGTVTRGIAGWIFVGSLFAIQPSQLAIPLVSLVMATLLVSAKITRLKQFLLALVVIAIPAVLIIVEPDLGTTVIYALTMGTLLYFSPVPVKYLVFLAGGALVLAVLAWIFLLRPYQKARITSFMGTQDVDGASYNARQALIAVGSGELVGRGLGEGVQSHLRFLPERQTDFIFASVAEELGFIGSSTIILLYASQVLFCIYVSRRTVSTAGSYFCIAAAGVTLFQSTVNMGMNMGMLPITGVTLPLLSYGGSSIIATCLLFGVVQSLTREVKPKFHLHLS